jgi:hypothetical protein
MKQCEFDISIVVIMPVCINLHPTVSKHICSLAIFVRCSRQFIKYSLCCTIHRPDNNDAINKIKIHQRAISCRNEIEVALSNDGQLGSQHFTTH